VRALLAAAALVAVITVPLTGVLLTGAPGGSSMAFVATAHAVGDIPGPMFALYQEAVAVRCPGLPWPVLAAVGKVETDHARNVAVSSAGARGPMQFMPGTWRAYGVDADGDGFADIENPVDAVHSAAHYLCASGGGNPATLRDALWAYNHANWYVDLVLEHAARYASSVAVAATSADAQALLANPRVQVTGRARDDLAAGIIDQRLVALLSAAAQRHTIAISVFRSGHSKYVAGTRRVSNHWCGQAADVFMVDGVRVSRTSPAARALAEWVRALPGEVRPTEVGQPWPDLVGGGFFTDSAHQGHLHLGYGPRCADL
jgi:hypothetical protein